jgi:hypothetical protein
MRKRWFWLALLVATALLVLLGWGWQRSGGTPQAIASKSTTPAVVFPSVDADRLQADLDALTFKRYTGADRTRARDYITQALKSAGWTPQFQPFANGINIYAEHPGTDPNAGTILLAGHYDTVEPSPGADDNATSVATVLEAARLLGQQPTAHTFQIALFDLEEQGLLGSKAFVEQVVKKENFKGAVIMDMIGYSCDRPGCQTYPPLPIQPPSDRGDFLAVIGDQGHPILISSFSHNAATLPQVFTLSVPILGPLTPDLMRSDHVPFWDTGLGAVLITDTANFRNPNYHQPTDTIETLDRDFFLGAAQLVVNAVTNLLQG